ncbi:MAG: sigma-70 family RNA polymerase sigma factor [Prevotella sp.]|nr:sigma-70 family RNA polymerase sigma factor [Prevotella sp.]
MASSDEKQLMEMLSNPATQRKAFELVVRQYSEQLYWQVRRIVLTHEDANDVMQNVMLKAWTNLDSFRQASKLSTWLYRIAINESLDFVRHQKTTSMMSADDDAGIANTLMADEYFDGDETEAQLQEAIAQLPDVQRTVFNLRYYDNMKYGEMSKVLNTSEGALKASYHIAVKKISDFFKQRD